MTGVSVMKANVSQTFRNSLLHENSGKYLWSQWDYLTNPYIYSLHKKNSLSFIATGGQQFSLGSSFFVFDQPIFLTFGYENQTSKAVSHEPLTAASRDSGGFTVDRTTAFELDILLGTVVWKNLGVGFYVKYKPSFIKQGPQIVTSSGAETFDVMRSLEINKDSSNPGDLSQTAFGVEFGQFSGGLDTGKTDNTKNSSKISYSASLGYARYGSDRIERNQETGALEGENTAPLIHLADPLFFSEFFVKKTAYFGQNRKEINAKFLGWYTIGLSNNIMSLSNIGINTEIDYRPTIRGRDRAINSRELEPKNDSAEVSVYSYRFLHDTFVDLDFSLKYGELGSIGALRLSPSIRLIYERENATFDEKLGNGVLEVQEYSARLIIPVKFFVNLNSQKTFTLVFGWSPHFILYHDKLELYKNIPRQKINEEEEKGSRFLRTVNLALFSTGNSITTTLRLGCQYTPFKNITLHFGIRPIGDNTTFSFNSIDFGLDFVF